MLEWVGSFVGGLKETTPALLLGVAIASAIVLFMGNDFASTIGLAEFRQNYRPYLGGALVLSLSLAFGQAIFVGCKWLTSLVKDKIAKRKNQQSLERNQEVLRKLTPDEKAYLAPYILKSENSRTFLIEDGVAGGLVAKGILYRASTVGSMVEGWAHNLQPWAREYLEAHPEYLEGATAVRKKFRGW